MTPAPRPQDADPTPFWASVEGLLQRPGVSRSTMMGLPCLRRDGIFFAAHDRRTGNLLVKLSEEHVTLLIAAGDAQSFAPAGRRFRQWAAVPADRLGLWQALLDEAFAECAAGLGEQPGPKGSGRTTRRRGT